MLSPLLIGIVISISVGIAVPFIGNQRVLVGICAALLGLVLTVIYDLHRRVDRRIEGDDDRSTLLAAVDDTRWLLKDLRDIATSADTVLAERKNKNLFTGLMKAKMDDARSYMQDLKRGRIRVPAGDKTTMSEQLELVRKTVHATTIPEADTDWWLSTAGESYLERNKKLIKDRRRRVRIKRIVLWEEWVEGFETVIEQQQDAGVELLFVKRSKVTDTRLCTNMAIYDGTSFNEVAFNFDCKEMYVEYYLDPSDAQQALARFEKLEGLAKSEVPSELLTPPGGTPKGLPSMPAEAPDSADGHHKTGPPPVPPPGV